MLICVAVCQTLVPGNLHEPHLAYLDTWVHPRMTSSPFDTYVIHVLAIDCLIPMKTTIALFLSKSQGEIDHCCAVVGWVLKRMKWDCSNGMVVTWTRDECWMELPIVTPSWQWMTYPQYHIEWNDIMDCHYSLPWCTVLILWESKSPAKLPNGKWPAKFLLPNSQIDPIFVTLFFAVSFHFLWVVSATDTLFLLVWALLNNGIS